MLLKSAAPANSRIPVRSVAEERSGADGRVVLAPYIAPERKPTNSCIVSARVDVETQKGVLAFSGFASGITSVWRGNNRVRCRRKCESYQSEDERIKRKRERENDRFRESVPEGILFVSVRH